MSRIGDMVLDHADDLFDLGREVFRALRRRKGSVADVVEHLRKLDTVDRADVDAVVDRAKASIRGEEG